MKNTTKQVAALTLALSSFTTIAAANNSDYYYYDDEEGTTGGRYIGISYGKNFSTKMNNEITHDSGTSFSNINTKLKNSSNISINFGYNFDDYFSLELSLGTMSSSGDNFKSKYDFKESSGTGSNTITGSVKSSQIFLNAKYNFAEISDDTRLFGLLGLGFSNNKVSNLNLTTDTNTQAQKFDGGSKNRFAFQFGLGLDFKINEKVSVDVSLLRKSLGRLPIITDTIGDKYNLKSYSLNQLTIGFKYNF